MATSFKNLFHKKLTPEATMRIFASLVAVAWLIAGCAAFAGKFDPLYYGSDILYGFGLIFCLAAILAWYHSLNPKAKPHARWLSAGFALALTGAGMVALPSDVTIGLGAGFAAVAAGTFLAFVYKKVPAG